MRRLKCEKETIILTNEDDGFYDVYTFNQSLQKRLRSFVEKYPDDCWLKDLGIGIGIALTRGTIQVGQLIFSMKNITAEYIFRVVEKKNLVNEIYRCL